MISRSCGINFIENVGLLSDEHSVATTEKIPTKCVGEHSVATTEKIPTKCVDEHSVATTEKIPTKCVGEHSVTTTEKIPPNVAGTPESRLDMYVEVFQSNHDNHSLDNDSVIGITEEEEQSMEMVTVNQHAVSGETTNETEKCSVDNNTEKTSTHGDSNAVTGVTHGDNIFSDVVGQGDNIFNDVGHGEGPKCTCGRVVVKKISRAVTPSELEDIEAQISMEYHQLRTQETTTTTTPTTTTTTKSSTTTNSPKNKHKSCGRNCLHCRVAHLCGWVYLIHYEHVFLQVFVGYFDFFFDLGEGSLAILILSYSILIVALFL